MICPKTNALRLAIGSVAVAAMVLAACGDAEPASAPADDTATAVGDESGDAAAGGEWEPEWVDGVLQPLPDGFPSQDLTLLVIDSAGSDDGIYARQVQQAASDMAPVNIQVLDRPDFGGYGTWEALGWMSEQDGGDEGHMMAVVTIPGATTDLLTTPVAEELGVDMDSLNFVLVTEEVPWVILGRRDAPWGNDFQAMVDYAKENPGEVTYVSRGPGAGLDLAFQQYRTELGFEVDTVIGGSLEEINLAIGAGAGDIAVNVAGVTQPFVEDERVHILTCTGNVSPCVGPWDEVPNAASIVGLENDSWGSNRGLVVTPETPDAHRLWLETLVREVIADEEYVEARSRVPGLSIVAGDDEYASALQQQAYDVGFEILGELGRLDPTVQQ